VKKTSWVLYQLHPHDMRSTAPKRYL